MTEENKKLYNFLLFEETVKALDEIAETLKVSRTTALELLTALGYQSCKELLKKADEMDKKKEQYVR
jgi:predicted transcriptional regulator